MTRFIVCAFVVFLLSCNSKRAAEKVHSLYDQQLAVFADSVDSLYAVISSADTAHWQQAFMHARLSYKKIEAFVEYYHPATAKAINGPAIREAEADDLFKTVDPTGFQVLEEMLFPADVQVRHDALLQVKMLQSFATRLKSVSAANHITDEHVFDALRLQMFRVGTISITGADNATSQLGLYEAASAVDGVMQYLAIYNPPISLQTSFDKLLSFLQKNYSFDDFDRAEFISSYLNHTCRQLHAFQQEKKIKFFDEQRAMRADVATLFDSAAFNTWSFAPKHVQNNQSLSSLGEQLFFDTKLSGDRSRSCASCHNPAKAFTDGIQRNLSFDKRDFVQRNTPTIHYASLQPVQFADSRVSFLEDQANEVIENKQEMHGNMQEIIKVLQEDPKYKKQFQHAFATDIITGEKVKLAISAFIRTKAAFNSRFDEYMRGNKTSMNDEELRGLNLFTGKAKCATCHFMPLFSGLVPPNFTRMESEVLGVPAMNKSPYILDTDEGKFKATGSPIHKFAFKTPTLRNIAETAPYMHNGVFSTLEEVVEFYDQGGGEGLGIEVPNQTLPAETLNLTQKEKAALVAFMKTLSDR